MRKPYLVGAVALLAGCMLALAPAAPAQISVGISVRIGPPPLRVLAVQPICPGPGYIWTPGYWAYGPVGYYWVPGAWVLAPEPDMLWTPGYWGWNNGLYVWHAGYWGPHVGFYGGVNYGWGYFGAGFVGGHWSGRQFYYNTAVWRVNPARVHTTYVDRTVVRNVHVNRISYNGGPGGIHAAPSVRDRLYEHEHHVAPTPVQRSHAESARVMASRGGSNRAPNARPAASPSRNRTAAPPSRARTAMPPARARTAAPTNNARTETNPSRMNRRGSVPPAASPARRAAPPSRPAAPSNSTRTETRPNRMNHRASVPPAGSPARRAAPPSRPAAPPVRRAPPQRNNSRPTARGNGRSNARPTQKGRGDSGKRRCCQPSGGGN